MSQNNEFVTEIELSVMLCHCSVESAVKTGS